MPSPPISTRTKLESWGPETEIHQVRVAGVRDLIRQHMNIPRDEASALLHASPGHHRYLLLEKLHETGHAAVYLAIDQMLARMVALKLDLREFDDYSKWNAFREWRTQALFEHEHIVRVFDVGEAEGVHYSVTELCDADMLDWSRGKPWQVVLRRILEAGRGLEVLHAEGFVHCDVKPANILIRDGVAKIGDFGLASRPARVQTIRGTPGYMAPEIGAGIIHPQSDVFGLASAAWTCLFGGLPFAEPPGEVSPEERVKFLIDEAIDGVYEAPPKGSEVPFMVVETIRHGLVPNARLRPTMAEWLRSLEWCLERANRPRRRWRIHPQAVGGAVFGVLAVLAVLPWITRAPKPEAPPSAAPAATSTTPDGRESAPADSVESTSAVDGEVLELREEYDDYAQRLNKGEAGHEEGLDLAQRLIQTAERLSSPTLARLARELAGRLRWGQGMQPHVDTLKDIIDRADRLNQSSQSSRPGL